MAELIDPMNLNTGGGTASVRCSFEGHFVTRRNTSLHIHGGRRPLKITPNYINYLYDIGMKYSL